MIELTPTGDWFPYRKLVKHADVAKHATGPRLTDKM